ncbi:MAG: hypothetical protein LBN23_02580, partial [Paludibacter sp.]|nr:hypothetical protein [Paludibacter sp.]
DVDANHIYKLIELDSNTPDILSDWKEGYDILYKFITTYDSLSDIEYANSFVKLVQDSDIPDKYKGAIISGLNVYVNTENLWIIE